MLWAKFTKKSKNLLETFSVVLAHACGYLNEICFAVPSVKLFEKFTGKFTAKFIENFSQCVCPGPLN